MTKKVSDMTPREFVKYKKLQRINSDIRRFKNHIIDLEAMEIDEIHIDHYRRSLEKKKLEKRKIQKENPLNYSDFEVKTKLYIMSKRSYKKFKRTRAIDDPRNTAYHKLQEIGTIGIENFIDGYENGIK